MGHGARRCYTLFAVLSILSMILIFVIGIQPPNDWALYITVGFFILTAIVWFAFENKPLSRPADRRHDREASGRDPGGRKGGRRDLTT